jgi:hypothetical protein
VNVTDRLTVAENNTSATWDLVDGSITAKRLFLGDFDNSFGTMTVSGGSIALSGDLSVGGAIASNAAPDRVDPNGSNGSQGQAANVNGVLIVDGSLGSIDVAGNLLANPADKSALRSGPGLSNSSLMQFILDSSGVTAINVGGIADLDGAVFDIDDTAGFFAANPGSVLTLIDAADGFGNVYTNTIAEAAGNGKGYSYSLTGLDPSAYWLRVIPSGAGQRLVLMAVPEPTSVVMFVMGIVGFWGSRRQRGC